MKVKDVIKNDPAALQPSDVYALMETFEDAVSIYSKHLVNGVKELVYYDSPEQGLEDADRYGSVWVTVDNTDGFMRLYEPS